MDWDYCRVCRVSEEALPGFKDLQGWICWPCYLDEKAQDPDVWYFLWVIDQQIPEEERGGKRDFHHTIPEWIAAVKSVTKIKDMRRFFRGCFLWHSGPNLEPHYSEMVTRNNIGCVMNELGFWARLKWWWALSIRKSQTFHS